MNEPLDKRVLHSQAVMRDFSELLQSLFAMELLKPSVEMWVISAWLGDMPILHNEAGEFSSVVPQWDRGRIRLTQILTYLTSMGSILYVMTNAEPYNNSIRDFLHNLQRQFPERVHYRTHPDLHEKLLIGDGYCLSGSSNLTYSGVHRNIERVQLDTLKADVAEARITWRHRWQEGEA
ncbi:MAG TPA: phospholipase D-like domain-containing protein DpdK [Anaerolineae bacterium]|jgi:hypothetical protein